MSTPEERLRARLDLEEPGLVEVFPRAALNRAARAVILTGHRLPAGWSHKYTDVLFIFPANYPGGCPDNVCARPDLRVANGHMPDNTQGIQSHAGREWLQFSWHIEAGDWKPTADPQVGSNLVIYLIGALGRFEEAS